MIVPDDDLGPIWVKLAGTKMKRVNQMALYRFGSSIGKLGDLSGNLGFEEFLRHTDTIVLRLRLFVRLYKNTAPASSERAEKLVERISEFHEAHKAPDETDVSLIGGLLSAFETSLADDLARLPTYLVEQIGAYSSDQLIASAENVFPSSMRDSATGLPPQVLEDFRKAGACLAFDLSTPCGFHAFRAADAMIRHYYAHFVQRVPAKKPRDWGSYIRVLRSVLSDPTAVRKPNKRTIDLLDSIRAMDRNPVIHPELDLDSETALATFDLCKNAIVFMAIDIRAAP